MKNEKDTNAANTSTTKKEKAKKGTSIPAQIKAAFLEILGEYITTGGAEGGSVSSSTLNGYINLFENVPATGYAGLSLEVQLANVESTINTMFESKDIDAEKLRILLNRKHRLQNEINPPEKKKGASA